MEETKVEKIRLRDGRYGEVKTREAKDYETGQGEVVYEHFEEEPKQLHLKQRVTEKKRPIVYERVIESINGNEVVERKVESIDPSVNMQLKEHIGLAKVEAQSIDPCYVTAQDLKDAMLEMAQAIKDGNNNDAGPRLRAQEVVENSVQEGEKLTWVEWLLLAVIGVEAAWIAIHIIPRLFNS
jgi:DNA-directed RNA polymerase specialized sigma54-like protein